MTYDVDSIIEQIWKGSLFLGERNKVATGYVVTLARQGVKGRLVLHTSTGQHCVWRLPESVIVHIMDVLRHDFVA